MPFRLYAMLTWTTLGRLPLIDEAGARFLERFFPTVARRHGVEILATGVVTDHVHIVVRFGLTLDIPRLVQGLKGASARIANRDHVQKGPLRWAHGYDLRSVSPKGLAAAKDYVEGQLRRHPDRVPP